MQQQEVKIAKPVQQPQPTVLVQPDVKQKTKAVKKKSTKKEPKVIVVKSKRKEAIARAYVKAGQGRIRINGVDINALESEFTRSTIIETVRISENARQVAKKVDIDVNVRGGGTSSQIQAARGVIARGLVEFSKSDALEKEFLDHDRSFIVDDPRRVEPKKPMGTKARAKFQTSYR